MPPLKQVKISKVGKKGYKVQLTYTSHTWLFTYLSWEEVVECVRAHPVEVEE